MISTSQFPQECQRHRVWGNLDQSRYFDIDAPTAANVEPVRRKLSVITRVLVVSASRFRACGGDAFAPAADRQVLGMLASGLICQEATPTTQPLKPTSPYNRDQLR